MHDIESVYNNKIYHPEEGNSGSYKLIREIQFGDVALINEDISGYNDVYIEMIARATEEYNSNITIQLQIGFGTGIQRQVRAYFSLTGYVTQIICIKLHKTNDGYIVSESNKRIISRVDNQNNFGTDEKHISIDGLYKTDTSIISIADTNTSGNKEYSYKIYGK